MTILLPPSGRKRDPQSFFGKKTFRNKNWKQKSSHFSFSVFGRFSRIWTIFWRSGAWHFLNLSLKLQISPPNIFWLPKESFKKVYKKKRYILVLVKYIYLPFCFLKCNISFNTFSGLWSLVSGLSGLWSVVKKIKGLKFWEIWKNQE